MRDFDDGGAQGGLPSLVHHDEEGEILVHRVFGPRQDESELGEAEVVASIQVTSLTGSRLVASDASGVLVSVASLTSWVAGTANQLTATDDGDGTITLSLPQNIHTAAVPQFAGATFTGSLAFSADNAHDLTAVGARPRDVFIGRNLTVASLTSGRVPYASTSGLIVDDAGLTYDGSTDTLTTGSVLLASAGTLALSTDVVVSRVSAGTGKVTNGANACEWRVHGDATKYAFSQHDGANAHMGSHDGELTIYAHNVARLLFDGSGHVRPTSDNGQDSGVSGAAWRSGYFGTSVLIGPSEAGVIASPNLAVYSAGDAKVVVRDVTNNVEALVYAFSGGTLFGSASNHAAIIRTNNADRLTISADGTAWTIATATSITLPDACNIVCNATTGTKIGTATTQKISVYNATPVVQGAAVADATDAPSAITQLNALLARIRTFGIIAT